MSEIEINVKLDQKETDFVKSVLEQYVGVNKRSLERIDAAEDFAMKAGMIQYMKAEIERAKLLLVRFSLHKNIN